jgi:MFS family permease
VAELILVLAVTTGLAAAARSTWSPCGLSMLSTITPLSERARGNCYAVTATWFIAGAALGGATLGAIVAAGSLLLSSLHPPTVVIAGAATMAALAATAIESGVTPPRFPIVRRQVNERWLDELRSWIYGAGFGWQIGVGVATYVMTPAVPLMIVLAVLTGNPWWALAVGTGFGTCRGLAVLMTHRLTSTEALHAFHRRFNGWEPRIRSACLVAEGVAGLAAAAALGVVPLVAVLTVLGAVVLTRRVRPATT